MTSARHLEASGREPWVLHLLVDRLDALQRTMQTLILPSSTNTHDTMCIQQERLEGWQRRGQSLPVKSAGTQSTVWYERDQASLGLKSLSLCKSEKQQLQRSRQLVRSAYKANVWQETDRRAVGVDRLKYCDARNQTPNAHHTRYSPYLLGISPQLLYSMSRVDMNSILCM